MHRETNTGRNESNMKSTMSQPELDRWYQELRTLKDLLPHLDESDAKRVNVLLRDSQNAFASETPVAWIAIVCEDYACPNTGAPYQQILPISRYRRVITTGESYGFGTMRFEVIKRGRRMHGIHFRSDHDLDDALFESNPIDMVIDLDHPHPIHGYNIHFCILTKQEEARSWLEAEEGILFEDSVQITRERLRSKT